MSSTGPPAARTHLHTLRPALKAILEDVQERAATACAAAATCTAADAAAITPCCMDAWVWGLSVLSSGMCQQGRRTQAPDCVCSQLILQGGSSHPGEASAHTATH